MNAIEFHRYLCSANACHEALEWSEGMTLSKAWSRCHRGDWMLSLIQQFGDYDFKIITMIKVKAARLVQHLMEDKRSLDALDVADKFALGNATRNELNKAYVAAYAVNADLHNATSLYYAAYAAAAVNAADTAYTRFATYGDFADETLQQCADICREIIPQMKFKHTK